MLVFLFIRKLRTSVHLKHIFQAYFLQYLFNGGNRNSLRKTTDLIQVTDKIYDIKLDQIHLTDPLTQMFKTLPVTIYTD